MKKKSSVLLFALFDSAYVLTCEHNKPEVKLLHVFSENVFVFYLITLLTESKRYVCPFHENS